MMITLLLVEDEPLICQGLRMCLEREAALKVVGEARDGAEAIQRAQALRPDVILMDISLPTMDGITATAALRRSVPESAIVLLSLHDESIMRTRARAAGAFTLVGKQEGVKALLAAIYEAGGTCVSSGEQSE